MKMKMTLSAIALCLFSSAIFAQQPTTFGLRGGVNFTNLNGKDDGGDDLNNKLKVGFNAGVNAEIPVGIDFYLQPGVLFTTKGAKQDGSDTKVNLSYVEVPVNFVYKPELGTGHLILGFGPYAAFGLGGKVHFDGGGDGDVKFKNDVKVGDFDPNTFYLKGFDAGANFLFGYETSSKLSVQLNAGLGLLNIVPKFDGEEPEDAKLKNTTFGVSLGYRF